MKRIIISLAFIGLRLVAVAQTDWEKVEKMMDEGSYKSAYAQSEKVFKRTKESAELLTAAWYMARAAAGYQEDSRETAVERYRTILPRLEAPERAVCYAFLGEHDSVLRGEEVLKRTPSDRIRRFCEEKGEGGVDITPTVYDVVVRQMIANDYYMRYRSPEEYLGWYRRLVEFHQGDAEELRICLDVELLDEMEELDRSYYDEKLIGSYIDKYRGSRNPQMTEFYNAMARYLEERERYAEAVSWCDSAIAHAPKSYGGVRSVSLKNRICAARINFQDRDESTVYPGQPSLHSLSYRNLSRLHFSVYPFDGSSMDRFFKALPKPLKQWQLEVGDDGTHRFNYIYYEVPELPQGRYLLVVTPDGKETSESAYMEFFCTEMKVARQNSSLQLFDARDGNPLVGQRVDFYSDYKRNNFVDSAYTDADGRAEYKGDRSWVSLKIKRGGYVYEGDISCYHGHSSGREMEMQLELMGDRPIYRPGDTVRFAALCFESDGVDGKVLPEVRGTFCFKDPNYEEKDTLGFITDAHGLASASFVIPADALGGMWSVVGKVPRGDRKRDVYAYWNVRVEEYKQPKFMVSLDGKPDGEGQPPTFGKPYTLRGIARAYSGASLAGAQVRYTVFRYAYGDSWWWRRNYGDDFSAEVASDTLEVAADGTFDITFTPQPDSTINSAFKPNFQFQVEVAVTDLNGETHEVSTSFSIGYQNYSLHLSEIPSEVSALKEITYSLSDLNNNPVKGAVAFSVQRLAAVEPLLTHPVMDYWRDTRHTLSREQFRQHFPGFAYSLDEFDPRYRAVEWSYNVSHTADGIAPQQTVPLPEGDIKSGVYRIVVSIDDLADTFYTTLTLPDERRVQSSRLFWVDASATTCEVGGSITLRYGSAFGDVRIYYTLTGPDGVERHHRWLPAGTTIKRLSIPVDTSFLGGFTLNFTAVRNGVVHDWSERIDVPFSHKKLNVDIATFRDKLQPGQLEEWTIKTENSTLIMTMFDDALSSYGDDGSWSFHPWRTNHGGRLLSWPSRTARHQAYVAFNQAYYEDVDGLNLREFTLKEGLFRSSWSNTRKAPLTGSSTVRHVDSNDSLASGVIKGTVVDAKTREPLPFVNVLIMQNGKQVNGGTTDFDGVYTIKPLREGIYDIEVTTVGYERYMRTGVKVLSTGFTIVDVQLNPTATTLEEIVIVEDKVPVIEIGAPESGMRLSSEDISRMPGNSVESIVAAVGGMGYSDGGTMQQPVQVRTNLNPYAFFVAGLHTDSLGNATYRFTVPEVLTRWKVMGMAYTDDLKSGTLERTLVTQKPLIVQPNTPRFLRHGDSIVLMAKVVLLEPTVSGGSTAGVPVTVILLLTNAATGDTLTLQHRQLSLKNASQVSFGFKVPHNVYVATYQITAVANGVSDGEQGQIPVVSSRQAVTLSQPVYINGVGEKTFHSPLSTLHSPTAEPHLLAAELVSNPLWLAVKSMPYLKQQENPSTLYLANSLYVNTLAKEILENLGNLEDTSLTPLKANSDIKQTLLEATPWLREAESEAEQRRAIANYFDSTRLSEEFSKLTSQLLERQNPDGGWSWMPDAESSTWITLQVLKRLSLLKQSNNQAIKQSLSYVDREEQLHYEKHIKPNLKKDYHWAPDNIDYLYTRSFYGKGSTEAYKFYYNNALKNYRKYTNLYTQAQLALIFQRHGDRKAARDLIRRLKEKSLASDEMGIYWRDNRAGYSWYERPIETQALLIQAFREITPHDTASIALMQQWLLKQKQTTHWGNDRATVEAISALMTPNNPNIRNTPNTLSSLKSTSLTLCGVDLTAPSEPRSTTLWSQGLEGYRSQRWTGPALDSIIALGDSTITLRKTTSGIAWGAVYYQYTDDIDKIPSSHSGITLKRTYLSTLHSPLSTPHVGDRVKVRIEISCDRTLEYLELIDGRPSCVEPLSTRAGWNWNQGLRYYVDVKNTATHCYINRLEKGNYIVEYDVYLTNPGTFLAGPVTIQCMYAPEFRATAPATPLTVE